MDRKECLKQVLEFSHSMFTKVMEEIPQGEDWVKVPVENSNHLLWLVGHLAGADNFFIGLVNPEKTIDLDSYGALFGKGSTPTGSLSDYPAIGEVVAHFLERRQALLQVLEGCSEDDFDQETSEGAPPFMPTIGLVFQGIPWHDAVHTGQLSVIHRMLGNTPISSRG